MCVCACVRVLCLCVFDTKKDREERVTLDLTSNRDDGNEAFPRHAQLAIARHQALQKD